MRSTNPFASQVAKSSKLQSWSFPTTGLVAKTLTTHLNSKGLGQQTPDAEA